LTVLPFAGEQVPEPPKIGALALVELALPGVVEVPVVPEELAVPVVPVVPVVTVAALPVVPVVPVDPVVLPTAPPGPVAIPVDVPPAAPVEPVEPADPPDEEPASVSVDVPEPLPAVRIVSDDNLVPHPVNMTTALAARQVAFAHHDLDRDAVGSRLLFMDPPVGRSPAARQSAAMFAVRTSSPV
jgi:hypothetical protein